MPSGKGWLNGWEDTQEEERVWSGHIAPATPYPVDPAQIPLPFQGLASYTPAEGRKDPDAESST